jgi:hypothetical protein
LSDDLFLLFIGFITGLIDAVAGGGGLISVPAYMLVLGPSSLAVGTNKVSALASALSALYIYHRNGFIQIKGNLPFLIAIVLGAVSGAFLSRFVPPEAYKGFMVIMAPVLLFVLFQRRWWREQERAKASPALLFTLGLICGIYDGIAGPGGGTLMFLSLFIMAGLPLTLAIGTAKLANVFSAGFSLSTYLAMGQVNWRVAVPMTISIVIGAWIGARFTTLNAALYARLALLAVSIFLIARLIVNY